MNHQGVYLTILLAMLACLCSAQTEPVAPRLKPEDYLRGLPQGEEVEGMLKSIQYEDYVRRLREISALKSASARAVLLRLAYGVEGKTNTAPYAGSMYIKTLTNQCDARALLAADHPEVIANGIRAVAKCSLDPELFALFQRVMELPHPLQRMIATRVLVGMPGEAYLEPKAKLIAQAIRTQPGIPFSTPTISGPVDFMFDATWSFLEHTACQMALSLGGIKGLRLEALAAWTPEEPGLPRDCLMMARAMAGDAAAMPELHRLLTNSPSACVRYHALTPLRGRPLTGADRAALEYMAAHDPFTAEGEPDGYRMVYGSYRHQTNQIHWLRWLAAERLKPQGRFR